MSGWIAFLPLCDQCGRIIVGRSTLVCIRATPVKLPPGSGVTSYTLTYTTFWCESCADILPPLPYDPAEPDYPEEEP
jgi:hypothetical protein